MNLELEGRVALVTGASSGLGLAVATELAREGAAVAIVARRTSELTRVAAQLSAETRRRVLPLTADVTDAQAVMNAVRETKSTLGPIDILVPNAGGPPATEVEDTTEAQYRAAIETNLFASIRLTYACLAGMRRRQWGRIIYLTSTAAKQPIQSLVLSNTARAGLSAFAKTLATECAKDNVLVNTILTGHFDTDRAMSLAAARARRSNQSIDEVLSARRHLIPMGRAGHPSELASVVAFLASERASFITGQAIAVDGGQIVSTF